MALAQQLAELALANSQGLLKYDVWHVVHDDDYRLLRQNLFEQHSNSALVPTEAPLLSVAGPGRKVSAPSPRVRIVETPVDSPTSRKPSLRRKGSFSTSVTNLLKRGSAHDRASTSYAAPPEPPSVPPIKRGFIPQLRRKASELFSSGDKRPTSPAVTYSSRSRIPQPSSLDSSHTRHSANTPLRSPTRTAIPTFPSPQPGTSTSNEIFDDRNLYSAKDIRAAIIATEAEAQRMLEAFDGLESSTSFRVQQQNARRLRAATPEHVTALMDGSNWRTYRPVKSPEPERKTYRPAPPTIDTVMVIDNSSIRSISSSIKTGLSRSKSISSLRNKQNPTSPLTPRFPSSASSPPPSILRKNSVSSITSQARLGVASNTSLSRSTGHLPLSMLVEAQPERPGGSDTDSSNHPEVSEVQRRREEVMARYAARLDFLRVKLKSAELHERLLRR
ncbi:hypothetical protein DXG01_007183 [Tephrocybe rancida]|nr:hypothetical protein DXG01_007183 [Tephrocybe rancida]